MAILLYISLLNGYEGIIEGYVKLLSKIKFAVIENNDTKERVVDFAGKYFIVISVREKGADALAYAIDRDGVVW